MILGAAFHVAKKCLQIRPAVSLSLEEGLPPADLGRSLLIAFVIVSGKNGRIRLIPAYGAVRRVNNVSPAFLRQLNDLFLLTVLVLPPLDGSICQLGAAL